MASALRLRTAAVLLVPRSLSRSTKSLAPTSTRVQLPEASRVDGRARCVATSSLAALLVLVVVTSTFSLIHSAPGDRADILASDAPTPEFRAGCGILMASISVLELHPDDEPDDRAQRPRYSPRRLAPP